MRLVLLCHPASLNSTSMPRFARMLGEGMRQRGHEVEYLTSTPIFGRISFRSPGLRKWMGYVDQFVIFPFVLRIKVARKGKGTLWVVTDQALGMWVPSIRKRGHVIHCHDFLAQRSALGEFPENPTGRTGRLYQVLIRRGYRMGRAFVSVSEKTREDLHRFLVSSPEISEVVYNPLNYSFCHLPREEALSRLGELRSELRPGFLLHVGGDQWYKNRNGVLAVYRAYCEQVTSPLALLIIGQVPSQQQRAAVKSLGHGGAVIFAAGLEDAAVHGAYAAAEVLIFPSLEEGFGWPIVEAQACGCLVLTTNAPPMNEVGGDSAFYLPRYSRDATEWAGEAARVLVGMLNLSPGDRARIALKGTANLERFSASSLFRRIESIYQAAADLSIRKASCTREFTSS